MELSEYPMKGEANLSNPNFVRFLEQNLYFNLRELPDGTVAGLHRLMFTTAICTNITWWGYGNRFCFEDPARAASELLKLEACDDEATGWIARR